MRTREIVGTVGMTLLTLAGLAVAAVLLLYATVTLPWWCAWTAPAVWVVGLVALGRLTWQDWRGTLRYRPFKDVAGQPGKLDDDTILAILSPGRSTRMRPGETHVEAMERLMEGEDL